MNFKIIEVNKLPTVTGVYFFLDKEKVPIYIGKALNIRARVLNHLQDKYSPKERAIAREAIYVKCQETNSEFEALVLEAGLVKKYLPKYNSALRDDKSPIYIFVTMDAYPKVRLGRKRDLTNNKFIFGPLSSVSSAELLLKKIRKIIPFCSDKKIHKRGCFHYQINLCDPCPNVIEQETEATLKKKLRAKYLHNIRRLIALLSGQGRKLLRIMEKEMQTLSAHENYEEAIKLRNKLYYLEGLFSQRLILDERLSDPDFVSELRHSENEMLRKALNLKKLERVECYDISTLSFKNSTASMVVFEGGNALKSEYKRFKLKAKKTFDPQMLVEVLDRRMQHSDWPMPDLIVIDGGTPQILSIMSLFRQKYPQCPAVIGIAKAPDRILDASTMKYLDLKTDSLALHYVQRVRDEAHRFAKKYHLLLRSKNFIGG